MKFNKGLIAIVTVTMLSAQKVALAQETEGPQETAGVQPIDKVAQSTQVRNGLKSKLSSLKSFLADFSQTVTDGQNEVLQTSEGKISLKQPNKMLWEVSEPNENVLIADGETLWHLDPFVEQAVAMDQQRAVRNNPIMLLTSPDSEAWGEFTISQRDNVYLVEAKDDESQIVKLELVFENDTLTALTFLDRQQQRSQLVFDNIQQNVEVSEALFVFALPAGFDLDDQRL